MNVTTFKTADKVWIDESGTQIPVNRITPAEKLMERSSARILREAVAVNKKLINFRSLIEDLSNKAQEAFMKEKGSKRISKGNFTWYNFDRSIKIEINVNEPIQFDEMTIDAAKQKFDEFLNKNINSENEFIKQMVIDAFETKRGSKLDTKRVLGLTRYEKKINSPLFSDAVKLINEAIRRPKSKTYYRVWTKSDDGSYESIDLNLSNL